MANGRGLLAMTVMSLLAMASVARPNQYKILVTGASIENDKRVGDARQPWDAGDPRPDPYVIVAINGQRIYLSGVHANATRARWFTGTEYWKLPMTATVTITLRDADAGKMVAGVGMVGVAVRPDIPRVGKHMINNALAMVDTDDPIAVWQGTLGQLIQACGKAETDLARSATGSRYFASNAGLTSLRVRVIERPPEFDVTAPANRKYLGLSGAHIEKVKRTSKMTWDVGLSGAKQPDPRYIVYVNGSPVAAGGVNRDSFIATWGGEPVALDLRDDDTIAVALFDADAGAQLVSAGQAAALYSRSLPVASKEKVFEALGKMSTDDLIFLWVGDWKILAGSTSLPRSAQDPHVWWNNGLARTVLITRPVLKRATGTVVRLTVVSANINATKSDGRTWDSGKGKPDPMVRCFIPAEAGGWKEIGKSKPVKDSLQPVWRLPVDHAQLKSRTRVKIEVYDKDALSNDRIGTMVVTLPDKPGSYVASGEGVARLVFQVDPR